jgi:hypothetical protein
MSFTPPTLYLCLHPPLLLTFIFRSVHPSALQQVERRAISPVSAFLELRSLFHMLIRIYCRSIAPFLLRPLSASLGLPRPKFSPRDCLGTAPGALAYI